MCPKINVLDLMFGQLELVWIADKHIRLQAGLSVNAIIAIGR